MITLDAEQCFNRLFNRFDFVGAALDRPLIDDNCSVARNQSGAMNLHQAPHPILVDLQLHVREVGRQNRAQSVVVQRGAVHRCLLGNQRA